jgi:hypothetical protein
MPAIAETWAEVLSHAKDIRAEWKNPKLVWFRGQGNAEYPLLPSLLRYKNGLEKEQELFQKFQQLSLRVSPRRTSDWETLFDMQHYGIPTRLLDWTETLGIAAFFAARSNLRFNPGKSATIYLLDPYTLNSYSGINKLPIIPDDDDIKYRDIYWHKKPFAPLYPLAINTIFVNDRMLSQRGVFTVHGDNKTPIEKLCDQGVTKIVLEVKAIMEALEFCEIANINEFTVYPDMAGIADYVRTYSGLES